MNKDNNNNIKNSVTRTFLVIFILCIFCSLVVSSVTVCLKSKQLEEKLLDRRRNILKVVGLLKPQTSNREVHSIYKTYVKDKILDFKTVKILSNNKKSDFSSQLCNDETRIILSSKQDLAKIRYRANQIEIYLINDDYGRIKAFVLPVYGYGLWSMMYAFIAIDIDGITSRGISYYSHSETPGLGGEVDNPQWCSKWIGKKLFNEYGELMLKIVRNGNSDIDNTFSIDGLSGATLTSNSIQKMFDFWLGENGFGPFLNKVRKGEIDYNE